MWRTFASLGMLAVSLTGARGMERYVVESVASTAIGGNRTVRIYLPPSYATRPDRRFPVLYLHDGQNVFSFAGTNIAFGWGSWELDMTADALSAEGKMQEIIMVGVDNSPARFAEYCGKHHPAGAGTNTAFENYEAFLIHELKPKIDGAYRYAP